MARSYRSVNPLIPSASSSPIREIASGLLAAKSASRYLARVANSYTSNVLITLLSSLPLCLQRFGLGVMNWWLTGVFWSDLWSMPMIAQWVFYWVALVAFSRTCSQFWNWKNKQYSLLILTHYAFHKQFHAALACHMMHFFWGWFSVADSTSYNVFSFQLTPGRVLSDGIIVVLTWNLLLSITKLTSTPSFSYNILNIWR